MAITLNWSERPEPNAPNLRDCAYGAGLTGMVYAGFTAFPKGIYTVAEREALERSDDQPNETGASVDDLVLAIRRRYKKDLPKHSHVALEALLARANIGLAVQGKLSNFPAGHLLRRWDPSFTGGHMVFVKSLGGGKFQWYDPLAPMKYKGDIVTKSQVLRFTTGLGASVSFKSNEFAPPVVQPPVVVPPVTYTEAQYKAVVAERDTAWRALKLETDRANTAQVALDAALTKITNAQVALK